MKVDFSKLYSNLEKLRKKRLMKRCRNLELKIRLDDEINKINGKLSCIWKRIKESFNDYCFYREQIIEFKGKYYDLYVFHCKYYEEVHIIFI